MRAEFEKRQAEWAETACADKERSEAALCEQQREHDMALREQQRESDTVLCDQQKESNAKWEAFVQQLQDDQAKCQKEVEDDYVHRVAELDKQRMQQNEQHIEAQQRLHVSQTSAQSSVLYQFCSDPSVQVSVPPPLPFPQSLPPALLPHVPVCAPPPPLSQLNGPQFAPLPSHPLIPANVLQQVPVVDFVQQHMIAQIPVTRQEKEVARIQQNLRDSTSDLDEVIRLVQKDFGAPAARANGAAAEATSLNNPADQSTACMLLTDPSGQNASGLNRTAERLLNPSANTFQPIVGDLSGVTANAGQAGFEHLSTSGPMSVQQYEATLDPNYVAN